MTDTTLSFTAASFFPGQPATSAPEHAPVPDHQAAHNALAESLYKGHGERSANEVKLMGTAETPEIKAPNAAVAALRAEREGFVDPVGSYTSLTEELREVMETLNPTHDDADIARATLQLKTIALDVNASHDDLSLFASGLRQVALEGAPDAETMASYERDSMAHLRGTYGADAQDVLKLTQRFVQRDPRLAKLLASSGMGSHPRAVARLAELALDARSRGQIK